MIYLHFRKEGRYGGCIIPVPASDQWRSIREFVAAHTVPELPGFLRVPSPITREEIYSNVSEISSIEIIESGAPSGKD